MTTRRGRCGPDPGPSCGGRWEVDEVAAEVGDGGCAEEGHGAGDVGVEPVEDAVDAAFAGGAEGVEVGAAGHAGGGAGGEGFDDVAAAPDAAVAEDLDAAADGVGDGGDEGEGGGGVVELAAAVVRERDGVDAGVGGEDGVGDGLDAFEDDGAVPDGAEPVDVGPGEGGVELGVDVVGEGDGRCAVADVAAGDVGEADGVAAHECPGPCGVEGPVDEGGGSDGGGEGEPAADVAFAAAEDRGVDGEHECLVARGGGALDHLGDEAAVAPGVDLEPEAAGADG